MPTVAVMLAGAAEQALAAEQIGSLASVRFCETVGSLLELVAAGDVDAVVADLRDVAGDSILPAFGALRARAPHLPLILHCIPTPEALCELPDSRGLPPGPEPRAAQLRASRRGAASAAWAAQGVERRRDARPPHCSVSAGAACWCVPSKPHRGPRPVSAAGGRAPGSARCRDEVSGPSSGSPPTFPSGSSPLHGASSTAGREPTMRARCHAVRGKARCGDRGHYSP